MGTSVETYVPDFGRAETEGAIERAETETDLPELSVVQAESISAPELLTSDASAPGQLDEAKSSLGNRLVQQKGIEAVEDESSLAESEHDAESNDVERAESVDGA